MAAAAVGLLPAGDGAQLVLQAGATAAERLRDDGDEPRVLRVQPVARDRPAASVRGARDARGRELGYRGPALGVLLHGPAGVVERAAVGGRRPRRGGVGSRAPAFASQRATAGAHNAPQPVPPAARRAASATLLHATLCAAGACLRALTARVTASHATWTTRALNPTTTRRARYCVTAAQQRRPSTRMSTA